jgi:uncharacterized cupin superfamily protein
MPDEFWDRPEEISAQVQGWNAPPHRSFANHGSRCPVKIRVIAVTLQTVALLVALLPAQLHAAPEPIPLKAGPLNVMELETIEPWPESFIISGVSEHEEKLLHRGEVVVYLYAARPLVLDISIPFTIDEFVWVLDGELVLTHEDGRIESYVAGDTLLVPKGFKGTWEMRGNYRELVVIETRDNDSSESFFKLTGLVIKSWFRGAREMLSLPAEELRHAELEPVTPTAADLEMTGGEGWKDVGTKRLYEGEFVVDVYSSPPTVVEISQPFPYDEFVWMLDGELVLTPQGGEAVRYGPGEGVLVPKGFMGTWETRGKFRELIIIERDAMERVDGD